MTKTEQMLQDRARKLAESHESGGKESLQPMSIGELYLLQSHYLFELNDVGKRLSAYPHNEVDQRRKGRCENRLREVGERALELAAAQKEREPERER